MGPGRFIRLDSDRYCWRGNLESKKLDSKAKPTNRFLEDEEAMPFVQKLGFEQNDDAEAIFERARPACCTKSLFKRDADNSRGFLCIQF